jgi:hypothetical protein
MMRRFHFLREKDASGVSGVGKVAEGCLFTDTGQVVVHWIGNHPSINIYNSIDDVMFIHGHAGMTKIIFDDPEPTVDNTAGEMNSSN